MQLFQNDLNTRFTILGPPFRFEYIDKNVFGGFLRRSKASARAAKAHDMLERTFERRWKYLLMLAYQGSCIVNGIKELEQTREMSVYYPKICEFCVFRMPGSSYTGRPVNISDDKFLLWHQHLNTLLLILKSHMTLFISTFQMSLLPDYSGSPIPI
jgi:hypothetical protein